MRRPAQERIEEQWQQRREDLQDPEFEGLWASTM